MGIREHVCVRVCLCVCELERQRLWRKRRIRNQFTGIHTHLKAPRETDHVSCRTTVKWGGVDKYLKEYSVSFFLIVQILSHKKKNMRTFIHALLAMIFFFLFFFCIITCKGIFINQNRIDRKIN